MKKKVSKQAHKTPTSRKAKPLFASTRIIIISSAFVVLFATVVVTHKQEVRQSVQGVSIMKGLFAEATIQIPRIPGAASYNIYYDLDTEAGFTHAARGMMAGIPTYTLQYLKKGVEYKYQIAAVDAFGKEIWFTPITPLTGIQQM